MKKNRNFIYNLAMQMFFLLGKEVGLKEDFLEKEISKLKSKDLNLEIKKIFFEKDSSELFFELSNNSFFVKNSALIIYDAENLKGKKEIDALASLKSNKTLFFLSEENKLDPKLEALGTKKVFYELKEAEKLSFLKNIFFQKGFKISNEALESFILMLSGDTKALRFYANSFILLFEKQGKTSITNDEVLNWINFLKVENSFSLFESILTCELELALSKTKAILEQGEEPILIVASLIWQTKRLIDMVLDLEFYSQEETFKKNKIFFNQQTLYKKAFTNYNIFELKRILRILLSFDKNLRKINQDILKDYFYLLIYSIIEKKGRDKDLLIFK